MTTRPVEQSLFPDHRPDRPVGPLPASVQTGTNADLIATIAPLYLTGTVLDVTYGDGGWWRRYQPAEFTAHDLYKLDGVDFRSLPEADSSVDTVCFDPPYVLSGGKSSAALTGGEFQNRFGIGIHNGIGSWAALIDLITAGLSESCRVARSFVLVKCMEFTQDRFRDMPTVVTNHAAACGWFLHDRIVHHTGSGPGGHNIWEAKRARRHHSYLLIFAKEVSA